jgi:DNA-directed RNA polymerase subunit L
MKAKKILKRLAKIEAWISDVTERSSARVPHIRELLQDAKAAVIRAKEAVQASSGKAKHPQVKHPRPTLKATPEPSKPKRKLSAAGRKAISEATKKRWAAKKAAAKTELAIGKKATATKAAAKIATPVKVSKAPARKVAKKAPAKKAAVKAPAKQAVRVVQAAKKPAPPKIEATTVTTPEQVVPETPV